MYVSRKQKEAKSIIEKLDEKNKKNYTNASSDLQFDKALPKKINPFIRKEDLDEIEYLKMLLGVVLAPLKLLLILALMVIGAFFAALSPYATDYPKLRFVICYPFALICRIILFIIGFYYIEEKGTPCKPSEATIVVASPHSTIVDSLIFGYRYNVPGFVSKVENNKGIFGTMGKAGDNIYVDRSSKANKRKVLDDVARRAKPSSKRKHLVIFPEGTCTNRKALINFKRGAFQPGQPVQPVVLEFPKQKFDPSWTAGSPRILLIYRLLCQWKMTMKVSYLPVYHPSKEEKENEILFGNNVRATMAKYLNVPTTEHSYEDMYLAKLAYKKKLPLDACYEFKAINKLFHISFDDAKKLLNRFTRHQQFSKDGLIDVNAFAKILDVPLTDPLVEVFGLIDRNDTGKINFYEFLVGVTMLSQNSTPDDAIRLVFEMFDEKKENRITMKQFEMVIHEVFKTDKDFDKALQNHFRHMDKDFTGYINFDQFKSFAKEYPEYVHLALQTSALPRKQRKLEVLQTPRSKVHSKVRQAEKRK